MRVLSSVLIGLVATAHVWFLLLEMVFWTKPLGQRTFRMSAQKAQDSAALAMNQGLYNGFLAAGLVWSLLASEPLAFPLKNFFLGCVAFAGVFGALTASRSIFFVQACPALLALALVWLSR
jgi:putative membrane protein